MRKLIIGFLLITGYIPALQAQKLPWRKVPLQHLQGTSQITQIDIGRQLEQRLARTYQQAKQAQTQISANHHLIMGEPIQKIFKTQKLNSSELYPHQQTFLKNSKQTGHYLGARNNRLVMQEIPRLQTVFDQIDENLPLLQQAASSTPQPQDPIPWLAEIMPEQTTQLFVGESHGHQEIHQAVARLVQHVRARQPEREIFLFTEFLPEDFIWGREPKSKTLHLPKNLQEHFPTWNQALEAHVQVVGLELPAAIDNSCKIQCLNAQGTKKIRSVWMSLEGIRLRNECWQKTLAKYRALHPNALFIIYTGADHSMYNRPFTLAKKNEYTFVSVLYPARYRSFEPSGRFSCTLVAKPMKGPLERLVDQLDFQCPVVQFQSPDLAQIAGFDVRIKLPVQLPDIDY